MMDSYFPIGTVIQTKGSIIQFMIIGYNFKKDGKVYDYVSVVHPVGITYVEKEVNFNIAAFNQEDVDKVYFVGYLDEKVNAIINHNRNISTARKKREEIKND